MGYRSVVLLAAGALAGGAVLGTAAGAPAPRATATTTTPAATSTTPTTPAPASSQDFFRRALLDDPHTTAAIRSMLTSGAAFVDPGVMFGDLTGDGRADAIVPVTTAGAAGTIAVYVFSTHGAKATSKLRAVYRNQSLSQASAGFGGGGLVLHVPRWAKGDDLCCPKSIVDRTYTWSDRARRFVLRSSVVTPAAGGTTTTTTG